MMFFENPKTTSEINGLDENLLFRFSVILQTIASGVAIDTVNFDKYARETAEYYLSLYDWYKMPVTVHKILIHGSAIIKNAMVPIEKLSEEPQKARNKDFRNIRKNNTRKFSRVAANVDLRNHLFTSFDPVIYSKRKINTKPKKAMYSEAVDLLVIIPEFQSDCNENENEEVLSDNAEEYSDSD
jgi:hypothetical protein